MSVDKLAEKYPYNSTYAFQENKMGLGRELEGLELFSERSEDGKSVTLTMKVKVVNNSNNLTSEQFNNVLNSRIENTKKILNGPINNDIIVNTNVIIDDKATLIMEFNDAIDPNNVNSLKNLTEEQIFEKLFFVTGIVNKIGDTQNNRSQVNVPKNLEYDKNGNPIIDEKNLNNISNTGTYEDLHIGGLEHDNDPNNIMYFENSRGNNLTIEQRQKIIENVEMQQP